MSTPFHKKLRIFLEELDKIIEKYEIYFDKNKDYKSYKRNVASQGGDPEISDSVIKNLEIKFVLNESKFLRMDLILLMVLISFS